MTKHKRRQFTSEFKEQAVARLSAPRATLNSVAKELELTASQLRTWKLELEAAGSAEALARRKSDGLELAELRRENKRLKEENEIMRKASAFFAQAAVKP